MARKPKPFEYSSDAEAGITRIARGDGFAYFRPNGNEIRRESELARIASLAIPPAWTDVWICVNPRGHLQATGKDARGRKQYRYHPAWIAERDSNKYASLAEFAQALPRIRRAIVRDLRRPALCKERVLAAVVRLMDQAFIRVGGERYRRENGSFGATTLRNRHARVKGPRLRLEYVGKSGKKQRLTIEDRRLARIVRRTQDLPGQHLFEYLDQDGVAHPVTSEDVNDYIREATGTEFTAKHFRTWGASLLAFEHILDASEGGKIGLKPMLEAVASALGNTPAISRKSYIHPALIELCRTENAGGLCSLKLPRATQYMTGRERALIGFLDEIADAQQSRAKAA